MDTNTKTKLTCRNVLPTLVTGIPANKTVTNVVTDFLEANSIKPSQHLTHITRSADKVIKSLGDNVSAKISLVPSNRGNRYHFTICITTLWSFAANFFNVRQQPYSFGYLCQIWLGVPGFNGGLKTYKFDASKVVFTGYQIVKIG